MKDNDPKLDESIPESIRIDPRENLLDWKRSRASSGGDGESPEESPPEPSLDPEDPRFLPVADEEYSPILLPSIPDPTMTFATMFPFKINSFALEVARIVAQFGGSRPAYNPLYCYAAVGQGKTHLLCAIANAFRSRAILVNSPDLEVEFERARRLMARAQLRAWIVSHDLLLIDDIQMCEANEGLQQEIFAILNHMMGEGRSVVITSDVPPTRLSGIESRLISRLGGGPIVELNIGTKSERKELLRSLLEGQAVQETVLEYLAENLCNSMRHLKASVRQLLVLSEFTGLPPSIQMASKVVPMEEPLMLPREGPERPSAPEQDVLSNHKRRFREMVANAETEEEQILALQIAVGERLRQLREKGGAPEKLMRMEQSLELLRDGKLEEAVRYMDL